MPIRAVALLLLLVGAMGCTSKDTEPVEPKAAEAATGEPAETEGPSYAFSKKLEGVSMEEALRRVEDALQANGFGVLTKIDIQDTFKTKIDVDFRPYVILGACNPKLAHKALEADPSIGLLLPCNIVVQEVEGGMLVSFADPKAMFELAPDVPIEEVATEARRLLENAKDQL
jgi:uncharacterized protein (DUF302 family)